MFLDHVQGLLRTIEVGVDLGLENSLSAVPKPFLKTCWRSRAIGHMCVLQDIKVLFNFRQLEKLFNFLLSPFCCDLHHVCFLLKGLIRLEGTSTGGSNDRSCVSCHHRSTFYIVREFALRLLLETPRLAQGCVMGPEPEFGGSRITKAYH